MVKLGPTERLEGPLRTLPSEVRETSRSAGELDLSVVVQVDRNRDALEIYREYAPSLRELGMSVEFLFVSSPGGANRRDTPPSRPDVDGNLRLIEVGQPIGQSAVLRLALEHSRGRIIITLPPALRVTPDALPELVRKIEAGNDVAVAWRWPRRDGWINRIQSAFVTWLHNALTGTGFHDVTCRVHAVRRAVLAEIPLYGSFFRFLPVVAKRQGFRVVEVPVQQHIGGGRHRVYRPGVYLGWLIDLVGIFFLLRFTYRPLRFFGSLGAMFALPGSAILAVVFVQRMAGQGIANRPILVLGVLLLSLGVQSVALGLLGEIIVHFQASPGSSYRVTRDS